MPRLPILILVSLSATTLAVASVLDIGPAATESFDDASSSAFTNAKQLKSGWVTVDTVDYIDSTNDSWYRSATDSTGTYAALELLKDDATYFSSSDTCLTVDDNAFDDVSTFTNDHRIGPHNGGAGSDHTTLPDGADLVLPTALVVDEFSFLTTQTHGGAGTKSYVVVFNYDGGGNDTVVVTIAEDSSSGCDTACSGTNYTIESHETIDGCSGSTSLLEVHVSQPTPTSLVDSIAINYGDEASAAGGSWLGGPLSATVLIDQTDYDSLFQYDGTYTSGPLQFDAGAHAIWYEMAWTEDISDGSIDLSVTCGAAPVAPDPNTDPVYNSTTHNQNGMQFDVACEGQNLRLHAELTADLDISAKLNAVDLYYTIDADQDGDGVDSGLLATYGIDTDCDDADPSLNNDDGDGDGHSTCDEDCDDADSSAYPGATEVCDSVDNNCDGSTDEGVTTTYYADSDGDGFGDSSSTVEACSLPSGYIDNDLDCDDTDGAVNPDATEVCDSIDNDCDGSTDDATATGSVDWYPDGDGDSYGNISATATTQCDAPSAMWVNNNDDCNDSDSAINPGATEVCDSIDNNCDGNTDDATATGAIDWYPDSDGDTYGSDSASPTTQCDAPSGYVADNSDCDDTAAAVNPLATEMCDSIDNDCNGNIDENSAGDAGDWYPDSDSDSFGDDSASATHQCYAPSGYVADNSDCNDSAIAVNTSATEMCDSIDNNCDGNTDENSAEDAIDWYPDSDSDLFGDEFSSPTHQCYAPTGYVIDNTDCDDAVPSTYPGATEVCGDAVDNDCDGFGSGGGTDEDGDGLTIAQEIALGTDPCLPDTDADGVIDGDEVDLGLDPLVDDSDGDGLDDGFEVGGDPTDPIDSDGDSLIDALDDDDDDDSVLTIDEDVDIINGDPSDDDTDGDSIPNYLDTDDDEDGIDTIDEVAAGTSHTETDSDGDGIDDFTEFTESCEDGSTGSAGSPANCDTDGTINALDSDSDNDNYPDGVEGVVNSDGDGYSDYVDSDDDDDGVLSIYEEAQGTSRTDEDTDLDGIDDYTEYTEECEDSSIGTVVAPANCDGTGDINALDSDSDDDGYLDSDEGDSDYDADGYPDYVDTDSDNDTILDADEVSSANRNNTDDDGDGVPTEDEEAASTSYLDDDSDDDGINDYDEFTETCEDGSTGSLASPANCDGDADINALDTDDDNDGIPTYYEVLASSDHVSDDSDGDGIDDQTEFTEVCEGAASAGTAASPADCDTDGTINATDTDSDDDGFTDDLEGTSDLDGDGYKDYVDTDDDNDGVPTIHEYNAGTSRTNGDTDGDGIDDYTEFVESCEDGSNGTFPSPANCDGSGYINALDTDSDDDGFLDIEEGDTDSDSDGYNDYVDTDDDDDGVLSEYEYDFDTNRIDTDSDGDGIDDLTEYTESCEDGSAGSVSSPTDCDSDGDINPLDEDSDEDGFDDETEGSGDFDGDGYADYVDTDSDSDGVLDIDEVHGNTDGTGEDDRLDSDDDNDLVPTVDEIAAGTNHLDVDSDSDNINDYDEFTADCEDGSLGETDSPSDCDGDGDINALDTDSDDDNYTDLDEGSTDFDGDGYPNYIDADDDDDEVPTADEFSAGSEHLDTDSDNDGIDDYTEFTESCEDGSVGTTSAPTDCDGTGNINALDTDSDDDGYPDSLEGTTDSDSDGYNDYVDTDDDDDGVLSVYELAAGTSRTNPDSDTDGIDDLTEFTELCEDDTIGAVNDPANCDGTDSINALDTDSDNDNYSDSLESTVDTDGDGYKDYVDTDDDDDGVWSIYEEAAGTNRTDADSDTDGIDDLTEFTEKCESGATGTVATPANCDSSGPINALDTDSDNDSFLDSEEGSGDFDGDSYADYVDTDSDNDSVLDSDEIDGNTDGTGEDDRLDDDDDDDGVPTLDEINFSTDHLDGDSDGDGISDYIEYTESCEDGSTGATNSPANCDGSGAINALDSDSDNDGYSDGIEGTDDIDSDGYSNYVDTDSDGDSVLDVNEDNTDTDGDSVDDRLDDDDDGDGVGTQYEIAAGTDYQGGDSDGDSILDYEEFNAICDPESTVITNSPGTNNNPANCDADSLINALDDDDDGDDISTSEEATGTTDVDGDGFDNYLDVETDGGGPNDEGDDLTEGTGDIDEDGIANYRDANDDDGTDGDADGDGLNNGDEASIGTEPNNIDSDGDSVDDYTETFATCGDFSTGSIDSPADCDDDGTINALDSDDDDDLVPTSDEDVNGDGDPTTDDTDSDGIPNYLDPDDDGDGIPTADEDVDGDGDPTNDDTDGDSIPDYLDNNDDDGKGGDSDNDGLTNGEEANLGLDPKSDDSDGDGIDDMTELLATCENGNFGSIDSPSNCDNDGFINALDDDDDDDNIKTFDEGSFDVDLDGIGNYLDSDSDGDGSTDFIEGDDDADCDNIPNFLDADDSDGPCIEDTGDTGPTDNDSDTDSSCGGCSTNTPPSFGLLFLLFGAIITVRRRKAVA